MDLPVASLNFVVETQGKAQQLYSECQLILKDLAERNRRGEFKCEVEADTKVNPGMSYTWDQARRVLSAAGRSMTLREIAAALKDEGLLVSLDTLRKAMWRRKKIFRFLGRSRFELK